MHRVTDAWKGIRYLYVILVVTILCVLFSFPARAGDVYLWTDEEGVVHITDDPRRLPAGDDVERIRYRDRGDAERQPVPDETRDAERMAEKKNGEEERAVGQRRKLPEDASRRDLDRKIERAREEYARAGELVEKRRREYSRKSTRHNRDQYRYALDQLAGKREKLRELIEQK
ncbi:MAG: DUF4124 domain-containing protein [Deltaproteobacteria bacterium]|nr:DUF4124 domain-containing protein [Deltaproteobacteria bacterium]